MTNEPKTEIVEVTARNLIEYPNKFHLTEQDLGLAVAVETAKILRSINGKLTFFVILIIIGLILSLFHL